MGSRMATIASEKFGNAAGAAPVLMGLHASVLPNGGFCGHLTDVTKVRA